MRTVRDCPEWDEPPEFVVVERIDEQLRTDPAIQEILNSALGVPGTAPVPGQVGEVLVLQASIQIPSFSLSPPYDTIVVLQPSLPAGDWMLWSSAWWQRSYPGLFYTLPPPTGFSGSLQGGFFGATGPTSTLAVGNSCHARTTGGTGLVFNLNVNPGAGVFAAGNFTLQVQALRLR